MVANKIKFVKITEPIKQELIANMRLYDFMEFQAGKEGATMPDMSALEDLIKSCDYNIACYCNDKLLFCSGLHLNALCDTLGVFWLLSTKEVEKHPISYFKANKKLCKKYLGYSPKGIACYISENYKQAQDFATRFGFKNIGTLMLDKLKHFIYILLGDK